MTLLKLQSCLFFKHEWRKPICITQGRFRVSKTNLMESFLICRKRADIELRERLSQSKKCRNWSCAMFNKLFVFVSGLPCETCVLGILSISSRAGTEHKTTHFGMGCTVVHNFRFELSTQVKETKNSGKIPQVNKKKTLHRMEEQPPQWQIRVGAERNWQHLDAAAASRVEGAFQDYSTTGAHPEPMTFSHGSVSFHVDWYSHTFPEDRFRTFPRATVRRNARSDADSVLLNWIERF